MARLPKYMKQIDQTTIQVKWWGVIYLILYRVMRCLYSFFRFWGTALQIAYSIWFKS
jgi:hypothetical protein